jgi:CBS domain-containing protein
MKDALRLILEDKGSDVRSVSPGATVVEAVRSMNEHGIGALLVLEGDAPVGIFTERDVLRRVLDAGRDPAATRVSEVMTEKLVCVGPGTTVEEAMAVITERRCRHLPVTEGGKVLGMVSSGDLTRWVTRGQAFEIDRLVEYVTSRYPA